MNNKPDDVDESALNIGLLSKFAKEGCVSKGVATSDTGELNGSGDLTFNDLLGGNFRLMLLLLLFTICLGFLLTWKEISNVLNTNNG